MASIEGILGHKGATIFDLFDVSDEADRVEKVALALDHVLEYSDLRKDSDSLGFPKKICGPYF